jgi:hypothetical protein
MCEIINRKQRINYRIRHVKENDFDDILEFLASPSMVSYNGEYSISIKDICAAMGSNLTSRFMYPYPSYQEDERDDFEYRSMAGDKKDRTKGKYGVSLKKV